MHYLDTSAIAPLFVTDAPTEAIDGFLDRAGTPFAVSPLCRVEPSAVLSRHVRMRRMDADAARAVLQLSDVWFASDGDVRAIEPDDWRTAERLVRRFELKLRAPDALHIAVCLREGLALVTFDTGQADAARAVGLEAVTPSEAAA